MTKSGWYPALWALQGIAMIILWVLWGPFRRPRNEHGVNMKAKRLHW